MKVPRTPLGKIGLGCMLTGQLVIVGGLVVWMQSRGGSPWATRNLIMALSGGGAALYYTGRVLQAIARRRQGSPPP